MKRLVLAAAVAAACLPATAHASATLPVWVEHSGSRWSVGSEVNGQPFVGAGADTATGRVCAGVSEQMPVCVAVPPIV